MKQINFIKTLSPQERHAITRWIILSSLLLGVSILSMAGISLHQAYQLRKIQQEADALSSCAQEHAATATRKKNLAADKQLLEKQRAKIERVTQHPKTPLPVIQALTGCCAKSQAALLSCAIKKQDVSVRVSCSQPEQALHLLAQLKEVPLLSNVMLTSLERHNGGSGKPGFIALFTSAVKK